MDARFVPLRAGLDQPPASYRLPDPTTLDNGAWGTTDLDPAALLDIGKDFAFFLHLHIPGLGIRNGPGTVVVADADATAEAFLHQFEPGEWSVSQHGPRRLWDTVEHAARLWDALRHPARYRFGITAFDHPGGQFVWLDHPEDTHSWPMPW